jgi:transcriptional regulator with XRE-family HTH domain
MKTHREYVKKTCVDKGFALEYECAMQQIRIAHGIRVAREHRGLTQRAVAEAAGVTQQVVSRIENASAGNMPHSTICEVAAALGMDVRLLPKRTTIERATGRLCA